MFWGLSGLSRTCRTGQTGLTSLTEKGRKKTRLFQKRVFSAMSLLFCLTCLSRRSPQGVDGRLRSPFFGKKNGGRRGIRTLGELPLGGFQDRCLKPLDHSSAL